MRNANRQMDCATSCMCSCKHETDKQRHLNIMAGESRESLLQESILFSLVLLHKEQHGFLVRVEIRTRKTENQKSWDLRKRQKIF